MWNTTPSNCEAAKADIVFLAVKPQFYEPVIREIRDVITPTQLIVSIAPGKSIQTITDWFSKPVKLIRTMPNTPAMVGEGVTALCPADTVTQDELNQVIRLFECLRPAGIQESSRIWYAHRPERRSKQWPPWSGADCAVQSWKVWKHARARHGECKLFVTVQSPMSFS